MERKRTCGVLNCETGPDPIFHCDKRPVADGLCASYRWAKEGSDLFWRVTKDLSGLSQLEECMSFRPGEWNKLWDCGDLMKDVTVNSKLRLLKEAYDLIRDAQRVGCTKCFPAGTKVLMSDGATRNIEDVRAGDTVLATEPVTGATGPRTVARLIVTEDDKLFNELILATSKGPEKLTATHEHPFWSPSKRAWVPADDLLPGMTLLSADKTPVTVQSNRSFTRHARTYNLTVTDLHTYYVLAGDAPVLVHNADCDDLGDDWTPQPVDKIAYSSGCEKCAIDIIGRLGGGQVYRARGPGGLGLWKYRDVQTGWSQHYFVVHNDRAYDAWTGRHGEPFDEYMAQWEDASETVQLTRGSLFWDPDLNGYRFRETG
ncbi:hypothetical protein EIZ62_08785 [Streptomyces ficellus]|uniref:Hint domain-containing protein n=2 Tax=Streptomyces ficellus TaxID=1977088 RepID=A0A6I6FRW1_9ACTN|nr:hypothetical protein EIZ62_08785 [Streptomyces ficellus]